MEATNCKSLKYDMKIHFVFKLILVILCYLVLGICDRLWMFGSRPIVWMTRITLSIAFANILLFWISKYLIKLPPEFSMLINKVPNKESMYLFIMILDYIVMILAYTTDLALILPNGYMWLNNILFFSAALFVLFFSCDYKSIDNRFVANFLLFVVVSSIAYYLNDGDLFIYMMYVFVFASYGISEMQTVKLALNASIIVTVLVYSLSLVDVLPYFVYDYGFVTKHNIGFYDPNGASMHVLFIALLFLYLNVLHTKVHFVLDFLVLFIAFVLIKDFIGARTSLLGVFYLFFITLGCYIYRVFFAKNVILQRIKVKLAFAYFCLVMVTCLFMSFFMAWFYVPGQKYWIFEFLGHFFDVYNLESRFMEGGIALRSFRPHLFGQVIVESNVQENYFWIDNFYIRAFLKYGIALLICNIAIFILLGIRLLKKERTFQILILTIIPIIGVSEALIGDPMYNLFPLLAFSNMDLIENDKICEKTSAKKILLFGIATVILGVVFPYGIAYLNTIFGVYKVGILFKTIIVSCILIIIYVLLIKSAESNDCLQNEIVPENRKNILKVTVVLCVLVIVFIIGEGLLKFVPTQISDSIESSAEILSFVQGKKHGELYSDVYPLLIKKRISDIKYSYLKKEDFWLRDDITVITDAYDDFSEAFERGFLFMQIADNLAIYTNDDGVVEGFGELGKPLYRWNSSRRSVDLNYEAELNGLELIQDGGVYLNGSDCSLIYGPYIDLGNHEYIVSYFLHIEPVYYEDDYAICTLKVHGNYGENVLAQKEIHRSDFDENGNLVTELQFDSQDMIIEFMAFMCENNNMVIKKIDYRRTSD